MREVVFKFRPANSGKNPESQTKVSHPIIRIFKWLRSILLIVFVLFFLCAAQPALAKCAEVKIVLQHSEKATTLTISGFPQEIVLPDGSSRCPTTEELINKLLEMFPGYILKEYYELAS